MTPARRSPSPVSSSPARSSFALLRDGPTVHVLLDADGSLDARVYALALAAGGGAIVDLGTFPPSDDKRVGPR